MHAPLLALLLAFTGPFASAQSPTSEAYNARATPLDDLSRELLTETGYVIREDGKIWDKIADNAVRLDEMSYLLARLAGARRLKALLELNLILNRSDGEKRLTDAERETVRNLLRKHWPVFGVGTRKDFRAYFSVKELVEELDKIPPRFDRGSALLMRDPDPATAPSASLIAAPISVTAPPPTETYAPVPVPAPAPAPEIRAAAEAPRQFVPRSVLTPFLEPLSLRRPSPFAPRAHDSPSANQPVFAAPVQAPAPPPASAPAAPATPPAIAALLGAMAPVDDPRPMMTGPTPPPAAPVGRPAATAPSPVHVAVAPAPPSQAILLSLATPRNIPVTSVPPAAAAPPPPRAPITSIDSTKSNQPSVPLFKATPPLPAPPAGGVELGTLKPWVPDSPSANQSGPITPSANQNGPITPSGNQAVVDSPKANPPALVDSPKANQADATQAEFDAFVANGPYSREGRILLKMLAEKAPEFCRAILRRTVVRGAPLIVFDGARAGADRRAGFAPSDPAHPGVVIALSAGPLLVERRKGLFGKILIALPEDPRAWTELGLAPPALDALRKGAIPESNESGPWGAVKIFGDRSRQGTYSTQEQAGELLERLLLLGLEREGFASSTYAARVWARAARLLFTARLADDYGNSSFLDPERKLELRDWIERGDESDDLLVASWSSSRGNVLDPRRGGPESQARYERQARESCTRSLLADHLAEAARGLASRARTIEALVESGLITADAARAAAGKAANAEAAARAALLTSPPACDGRFGADENGLRRSSALLAEVSRAERAFRERKTRGANHD